MKVYHRLGSYPIIKCICTRTSSKSNRLDYGGTSAAGPESGPIVQQRQEDANYKAQIHFSDNHAVKGPQEATLDSHLLLMASNVGAQKARAMKSGSGAFDVDEFLSKLVNFLKDRKGPEGAFSEDSDGEDYGGHIVPLDWDRIGRKAMAKSRRVPMMGFMSVSSPSYLQ